MWRDLVYILWCLHIVLEVLPISSSGHVTLLLRIIKKEALSKNIEYLMHIPTALIICTFLYRYGEWDSLEEFVRYTFFAGCAAGITALWYLVIKEKGNKFPLWLGFLVTSALLFSVRWAPFYQGRTVSFAIACSMGLAQGCALLPGISRLATTFVVGCWLGLAPDVSFLFSLAIQVPLISVAVTKALYETSYIQGKKLWGNSFGIIAVCVTSLIAYKFLVVVYMLLKNRITAPFAWYMLIPFCSTFFVYGKKEK